MPAAPRLMPESSNVTTPVGSAPVTVAVKITAWPTVDGLALETSPVVVVVAADAGGAMARTAPAASAASTVNARVFSIMGSR